MLVHVDRLMAKMDEEGLAGIVATTAENVFYLSGVASVSLQIFPHEGQCYAVITRDRPTEPAFVASQGEIDQALDGTPEMRATFTFGKFFREQTGEVEWLPWEERLKQIGLDEPAADPLEALVRALQHLGLANQKVGIDEMGFRRGYFEALGERLPQAQLTPASALLRWVRRVKTAEEVRRLAASARVTETAIAAASAIAREGITEYEMAREFERSIVSQGGSPRITLIRFGRNAVAGQVTPDRTPLRRGDVVWFDVGCVYQGYWSDLARNVSVGEPSAHARRIYQAMLEGEERAIQACRPGMTGGDLYELTMKAAREAGAPHYRRHHVGHGIGAEVYEAPLLAPGNQEVMEEGSVINIETPYYEFGVGALHVEDPFVVGARQNRVLTTLSRELKVVEH